MKEFDEFFSLVQKSIKLDPWAKNKKTIGYCKEIINESNELIEAIQKNDLANIKEELGDILYDWLHAIAYSKEEYNIEINEIINLAKNKLKHRKPYLLENKEVSLEESLRIWKEQKQKEKNQKKL
ncbi:MAG: MazG nucleotide pyrophosphohydrolase domain-containing protein [Candidatus Woesearchaeota archaeon]